MVVNPNFTPIFDPISDEVHVNVSSIIASQPPGMTTATVWIIFSLVGIGLLLLSCQTKEETCNDLAGIMSSLFLLVSAIQAFAVDTITGYGVTSLCETMTSSGVCTHEEFVLLENHVIYHYDLWGVVLGILFVLSLANLYRLWLNHKRITQTEQEPMDRGRMVSGMPQARDEEDTKAHNNK